jgi:hypothetical protein
MREAISVWHSTHLRLASRPLLWQSVQVRGAVECGVRPGKRAGGDLRSGGAHEQPTGNEESKQQQRSTEPTCDCLTIPKWRHPVPSLAGAWSQLRNKHVPGQPESNNRKCRAIVPESAPASVPKRSRRIICGPDDEPANKSAVESVLSAGALCLCHFVLLRKGYGRAGLI